MDITSERVRRDIPTSKADLFDFVNATSENLKAIGIEPHNHNSITQLNDVVTAKEANNNHLMMNTVDMTSYTEWPNIDSSMLEELNCWTAQEASAHHSKIADNTDGAIYTLTVLNGAEHSTWFKTDDKEETKLTSATPLDLETILLNGISPSFPTAYSADGKPPEFTFDDSGFGGSGTSSNIGPASVVDVKKEELCSPTIIPPSSNSVTSTGLITEVVLTNPTPFDNNNEWKQNNNEVDSLLRNALQGKSLARYNGIKKEPEVKTEEDEKILNMEAPILYEAPSLIDSDNPSSAHSMEDMFLSQLDVSYPEDYEKLKRIETEVAESVEQFNRSYIATSSHIPVQSSPILTLPSTTTASPTTTAATTSNKTVKKYTKRSKSTANNSTTSSGVRKERSLHYCTICNKGFKDKYSVNVHIRTHTGEKPFTCSLCGKSFRQKAHLAKHYQTHMAQAKNGITASSQKSNKSLVPSS